MAARPRRPRNIRPADCSADPRPRPPRRPRALGGCLHDRACGDRVARADCVLCRRARLRGRRFRLSSAAGAIASSRGASARGLRAMRGVVCLRACRRHRVAPRRHSVRLLVSGAHVADARGASYRADGGSRARRSRASVQRRPHDLRASARRCGGVAGHWRAAREEGGARMTNDGGRKTDGAGRKAHADRASRGRRALRYHSLI